ncbi:MAG: OmpA family protein [Saprospiraceae bacterium]|nr:OmpA family protein [Saprospiraceae bacterium]
MQRTTHAMLLGLAIVSLFSCVKPRIYRAEIAARAAAEGREKVLLQELLERRKETAQLTKTTENLARDLGKQDTQIADLKEQLAVTSRSMGESASKLAGEKSALEKNLATTNATLELRNALIKKLKSVQDKRKSILSELEAELIKIYFAHSIAGVTVLSEGESIMLSLPDVSLFEPSGVNISAKGKDLLQPLAEFLAARPALSIEVVAYTDNILPPKEKSLKDTWDWSLVRATNVVRVLIRDFNVNANQITPIGKGEFYPITSNETSEGRQKNRRTVVVLRPVLPAMPGAE